MLLPLLLTASLLSVPPAAAADDPLAEQVHALVRQLAADTLQQRDTAERGLLRLGPRILDLLPALNDRMPAEMGQRLVRVRQQLESSRAKSATDGSRVTIHSDGATLDEFLKLLQQQSGNRLVDIRPRSNPATPQAKIAIALDHCLFWEALDTLLDRFGLSIDLFRVDASGQNLRAVAIVTPPGPRTPRRKHASYSGAFRFEPLTVTARRGLSDPADSGLDVQIEAEWEPRLTPITLSFPRDSVAAVLDNGRPWKVAGAGEEQMAVHGGCVRFVVLLALPPQGTRSIQSIRGKLKALLPGYIETFRLGPLSAGSKFSEKKGSVTLNVDGVRRSAKTWEVGIGLRFDDAAGALQSHLLGWVAGNEVWLERPDGARIEPTSREPTHEGEDDYGAKFVFPLDGDIQGCKLVYRTPSALVPREIPFELKDIELP